MSNTPALVGPISHNIYMAYITYVLLFVASYAVLLCNVMYLVTLCFLPLCIKWKDTNCAGQWVQDTMYMIVCYVFCVYSWLCGDTGQVFQYSC